MSASAGAPPPNQPPGGGGPSRTPPNEDDKPWPNDKAHNGHNNWTKNTTVKTCKCKLCDQRVRKYSWKCTYCSRHICNECAEQDGASRPKDKYLAKNFLDHVDGCFYQSGQPPAMQGELEALGLVSLPQKRTEVMQRDKLIKAEVKRKKAQSQAAGKRQKHDDEAKPKKQRTSSGAIKREPQSPEPDSDDPRDGRDGTYSSRPNAEPTIASQKAPRKSAIPRSYDELSSDDASPEPQTPDQGSNRRRPAAKAKQSAETSEAAPDNSDSPAYAADLPCRHLDGGDTIIIGAGIVGLCIARELAMKAAQTNTRHNITVVEIRDSPCELASGNCSGVLGIHGMPRPLNELSEIASEGWTDLLESPGFIEATDYRNKSVYQVIRRDGKGRKNKPSWYVGHELDSFKEDQWTVGKLDTKKMSSWLYQECQSYGVEFIFHHEVDAVFSASNKDVSSVAIKNCHDREKPRRTISCRNVVFAAGAWTTELFKHLFRNNTLQLDNHVKKAYWYYLQSAPMSAKEDAGLLFADLASTDETLDDKITIVGQEANQRLIITGVGREVRETELNAVDALDPDIPDAKPLRHLKRIAAKRLGGEGQDVFGAENATRGFSFVSTCDEQLPVIDKVPTSDLGGVSTGDEDVRLCGIWLCYGFGMYGTTLAPGAARCLVRRMFGEPSQVDDFNFAKPTQAQSKQGHASRRK